MKEKWENQYAKEAKTYGLRVTSRGYLSPNTYFYISENRDVEKETLDSILLHLKSSKSLWLHVHHYWWDVHPLFMNDCHLGEKDLYSMINKKDKDLFVTIADQNFFSNEKYFWRTFLQKLEGNTTLTQLSFEKDKMSPMQLRPLLEVLEKNALITALILQSHLIEQETVRMIAEFLRTNITLKSLFFKLGGEVITVLVEGLKVNKSLKFLGLKMSYEKSRTHALVKLIEENTSLTVLYLYAKPFDIGEKEIFADALRKNYCITNLDLDLNLEKDSKICEKEEDINRVINVQIQSNKLFRNMVRNTTNAYTITSEQEKDLMQALMVKGENDERKNTFQKFSDALFSVLRGPLEIVKDYKDYFYDNSKQNFSNFYTSQTIGNQIRGFSFLHWVC